MKTILTAHFDNIDKAEEFFLDLYQKYSDVRTLEIPETLKGYYKFTYSQKRETCLKTTKGQLNNIPLLSDKHIKDEI